METFKKLKHFYWPYKRYFITSLFLVLIVTMITVIYPMVLQITIDEVILGENYSLIPLLSIGFILLMIIKGIANIICFLFQNSGMTQDAALGWTIGIIEMSNGVHMVSSSQATVRLQLSILSFLLAWGGFSIHAQSLHFIRNMNVKSYLYIVTKFFQGTVAFVLSWVLYPMYTRYSLETTPVFLSSHTYYFPIASLGFVMITLIISLILIRKQQRVR